MKNKMNIKSRTAVLFLAVAPFAMADFIVTPAGGTSVGLPPDQNAAVTRNLGGTFSLFGNDITSINIATNGFLATGPLANVSGTFLDRTITELTTARGSVISPFFDHLSLGAGSSVTDRTTSTWYGVTYQGMFGFNDVTAGRTSDFQVILFFGDKTFGGFNFHAGDIAISYGNLNSTREGTITVGVGQENGSTTGNPASATGQLANFNSLPRGSQFLLYRPHNEDGIVYSVSIEDTAVPEPASLAITGIGLAALGFFGRRATRKESR